MTDHHIFIHMPYAPQELHNMAWDVEQYPAFINFISQVRVRERSEEGMLADVVVRYKFLRETFATNVHRKPDTREIRVALQRGPLRRLENRWKFHPLSDGTTLVEFYVGYEFAIPMLGRLFAAKRDRAEQLIIASFTKRAGKVCTRLQPDPGKAQEVAQEIAALERGLQKV